MTPSRFVLPGLMAALLLSTAGSVAAQAPRAAAAQSINTFGINGQAVPEIVRSFMAEDFFTQPVTDGLASGMNFVAAVPSPRVRADLLELSLRNTGNRVSDVVIATTNAAGHASRNFIVHLEVGASEWIDMRPVAKAERVYLISMQAFDAAMTTTEGAQRLTVLPPSAGLAATLGDEAPTKGSFGSCSFASRNVTICGGGGCITATARRNVLPQFPGDPQEARASVQYPIGSSFHCSNGRSELDDFSCAADGYPTRRCDGTAYTHYWSGLDDTILYCFSSSAFCTSGCSGSWSVSC